jgi:membrane protein DedA with SNARE-associated domain
MAYHLAANAVLLLHLLFICLVMLGGLLVLRWPRFAMVHVPAAIWGVLVEAMGWYCPLTDLENALLALAGQAGYAGGFIERYLLAVIYPEGLTRETQIWLAGVVVVVNAAIYGWVLRKRRKRKEND